ncbi:hypothetical protein DYB25_005560 [Aphanomyces astaci]|uniref:Metallo-beta-lactamase domain-containing protein n=1 Tax=Aphanomyces astaci TaxID=112090 RepID=A0A397AGP4_APHAT|nr:hypothetical protein DYB25_005560 [Aphanomyces astaci]
MVFLGTASMVSSPTRHVAGIGVVIGGDCWIFDAGEGTGTQLAKSSVLQSAVSRVFVTHMHGDHVFGLMGLLLSVGSTGDPRTIQVVGPPGLRRFLRRNLADTQSNMKCQYRVDELCFEQATDEDALYLPLETQGLNVLPCADGTWRVPPSPSTIKQHQHRHPHDDDDNSTPMDEPFHVHECTNAFVESLDGGGHTSSEQVEAATYVHGHSTPRTAGRFAQAIQCRHLILTHFSRRYKDDGSMEPVMDTIRRQCGAQYDAGKIECAHDLEVVTVKIPKEDRYTDADQAYKDAATAADEAKAHAQAFFHAHESLLLQLSRRSRRLLE